MSRVIRVPVDELRLGVVVLDRATSHYLARVHRVQVGDAVVAFDPGARQEAEARVVSIGKSVRCDVGALRPARAVSDLDVTLVQALGKGEKVDQVVRDATALGVRRVVVVESDRAAVRLGTRGEGRRERWHKVSVQAARQCGRGDLPDLVGPLDLESALDRVGAAGERLVLDGGAAISLAQVLTGWDHTAPLAILIGPEGGLSGEELALARQRGFAATSFGPFCLRTETAATAVLGAVLSAALRPRGA